MDPEPCVLRFTASISEHYPVPPNENPPTNDPRFVSDRVDARCLATDHGRRLLGAWDRWRGDDLLPQRRQVVLDDIKDLLALTMLLEVESDDQIIFRLAGSMVDAFLGTSVTGQNFLDYAPDSHRGIRAERMLRQVAHPCGARSVLNVDLAGGYQICLELVALPVRPDNPNQPMQLISVGAAIADRVTVNDPTMAPLRGGAAVYQYFDIGAGVPDATPG
jgi:hypothetical protein